MKTVIDMEFPQHQVFTLFDLYTRTWKESGKLLRLDEITVELTAMDEPSITLGWPDK